MGEEGISRRKEEDKNERKRIGRRQRIGNYSSTLITIINMGNEEDGEEKKKGKKREKEKKKE